MSSFFCLLACSAFRYSSNCSVVEYIYFTYVIIKRIYMYLSLSVFLELHRNKFDCNAHNLFSLCRKASITAHLQM